MKYDLNDNFTVKGTELMMIMGDAQQGDLEGVIKTCESIIASNKLEGRPEAELKDGLEKLLKIFPEAGEIPPLVISMTATAGSYRIEGGPATSRHFGGKVGINAKQLMESIEQIVRATEICTLRWALNKGGGLNTEPWAYKEDEDGKQG